MIPAKIRFAGAITAANTGNFAGLAHAACFEPPGPASTVVLLLLALVAGISAVVCLRHFETLIEQEWPDV